MKINKDVHSGHRDRLKNEFITKGLDSFVEEHKVLELVLFFSIPQQDTNPTAHALIDRFDSLAGVFGASFEDLLKVDGIGRHTAALIKLIPECARRIKISEQKNTKRINSVEDAGDYLIPFYIDKRVEQVVMLCLDAGNRLLCRHDVTDGIVNHASFYSRSVIEIALKHNAVSIILAHNHLSGNALPSQEDLICTKKLKSALDSVGIELKDHIIISGNDYVSLSQSGFFERP